MQLQLGSLFNNLKLKFSMNLLNILGFLFTFVTHILSSEASLLPLTRIVPTEEFFPGINGNLTKVTWDHAVNTLGQLYESLESDVMMIEADIVLGKLNGGNGTIPIMAHPPNITSDLSLENFLEIVIDHNKKTEEKRKGVKLDFKKTEAFEQSVKIINNLDTEMNFPVWLNADILPGPVNTTETPVDANIFISESKTFQNAMLSLGWKTNYGNGIDVANYSKYDIENMVSAINNNSVSSPITFPVRAGIAAQSSMQLVSLLEKIKNSTLTIWGSEDDEVEVEDLRNLIKLITIKRVYIDVPENLLNKLKLDQLNAGMSFKPFALITAISALLVKVF